MDPTAALSLQQLRRLVFVAQNLDPESPPLAAYLDALLLFIEGFAQGASGSRLLYIARPPIVFYGLYGIGGPDQATRTLINLVIARGALADLIDCVLECSCTPNDMIWQILLDKVLYDLDRAIDYFSLGSDPLGQGEPENRARTFGLIIEYLLNFAGIVRAVPLYSLPPPPDPRGQGELPIMLTGIRDLLIGPRVPGQFFVPPSAAVANTMLQELCMQDDGERQWVNLLQTMAPSCHSPADLIGNISAVLAQTRTQYALGPECVPLEVTIPPTLETSLAGRVYGRFSEGRLP